MHSAAIFSSAPFPLKARLPGRSRGSRLARDSRRCHQPLTPALWLQLVSLIFAFGVAGCSSAPKSGPAGLPAAPEAFKEADLRWTVAAPAETQPRGTWWKAFADPVLDGLVERADRGNTSIQLAAAKLEQARAQVRTTNASRFPQANLNSGVSRQGGPIINAAGDTGTLINAGVNLSYEVDLFGRLRKAIDAVTLDAQAKEALMQGARLLVQADVAQSYFSLRALDRERAIVRGALAAHREVMRLTERRYKAGLVAELDVVRLSTEVAATESELLALDRRRAELEHALAVLVGEVASTFKLDASDWVASLPVIPPGIPSTVLARRPDVSAAQRTMLAAQARLGVAKAAWFPSLSLTAAGGYASPEIGDLFKMSMRAWAIGGLLAQPLFDGGRREAGVKNSAAELAGTIASYREQILVAFKDVEDQLSALRLLADQAEVLDRAVTSATRATLLSDSRYRNGLASQLDSLDARRTELRNQRQALQVHSAQYLSTVGLVRAMGGGW
jgi:outer membrane protein, multidrug efflux system